MKNTFTLIVLIFNTFIYSQNGVGINTATPTANFHLLSEKEYIIKFQNRAISNNRERILVSSDNQGTLTPVETTLFKNLIFGQLPGTAPDLEITNSSFAPSTIVIKLPRGRWVVKANILLELSNISNYVTSDNNCISVEATLGPYLPVYTPPFYSPFMEDNTPETDDPSLTDNGYGFFKGNIVAPLPKGVLKGDIIINNSTERYYRVYIRVVQTGTTFTGAKLSTFGKLTVPENQLFAVPLN